MNHIIAHIACLLLVLSVASDAMDVGRRDGRGNLKAEHRTVEEPATAEGNAESDGGFTGGVNEKNSSGGFYYYYYPVLHLDRDAEEPAKEGGQHVAHILGDEGPKIVAADKIDEEEEFAPITYFNPIESPNPTASKPEAPKSPPTGDESSYQGPFYAPPVPSRHSDSDSSAYSGSASTTAPSAGSENDTSVSLLDEFPTVLYPPIVYEVIAGAIESFFCPFWSDCQENEDAKNATNSSGHGGLPSTVLSEEDLNDIDFSENDIDVDFLDPAQVQKRIAPAIDKTIDFLTRLKEPQNVRGIMTAGFYSFTHLQSLFMIYGASLQRLILTQLDTEHAKLVLETMADNIGKELLTAYEELEKPLERVFYKLMKVTDDPDVERLWDQLHSQWEPLDDYIN